MKAHTWEIICSWKYSLTSAFIICCFHCNREHSSLSKHFTGYAMVIRVGLDLYQAYCLSLRSAFKGQGNRRKQVVNGSQKQLEDCSPRRFPLKDRVGNKTRKLTNFVDSLTKSYLARGLDLLPGAFSRTSSWCKLYGVNCYIPSK